MRSLVAGTAKGTVLRLDEPLSFWGGLDPTTGEIIDTHHPQKGESVAGTILVMAYGRGSSSSSQVLAEALRLGNGPAGIVLVDPDQIITLGAFVAALMYGVVCPVVLADGGAYERFVTGVTVEIGGDDVS